VVGAWLAVAAWPSAAHAAVIYSAGTTYSQDFNSLPATGGNNTFLNDSTLTGWYLTNISPVVVSTNLRADNGNQNSGAFYSYGTNGVNPTTDRALGSIASGTSGTNIFGVQFVNNESFALTNFNLSIAVEQWRRANNTTQRPETNLFSFQVFNAGAGNLTNNAAGWIALSVFDMVSTNILSTAVAVLDGNASTNRYVTVGDVALDWQPGQELWLRWVDINNGGNDHGLGLDDLVFVAVPEPGSTVALLALAAGAATRRRRSRR
jgi:hypothetical protein